MKKLLLFILIINSFPSSSQVFFQKLFGKISPAGLMAHSVYQTADGGYVAGGGTGMAFSYSHAALVKFDSLGNEVWNKIYNPGGSSDISLYALQANDSGYLLVGYKHGIDYELYIIKTDASGNVLWAKTYGGLYDTDGFSAAQTADGGYVIAGTADNNGAPVGSLLVKMNAAGNVLWTRLFNDLSSYGVIETPGGGFVLSSLSHNVGSFKIGLTKTDSDGNLLWHIFYEGVPTTGTAFSFCRTMDNGFIVAGHTDSVGAGNNDIVLVKTDSSGNILWSKAYGGAMNELPYCVKELAGGDIVIAGTSNSFSASSDVYFLRTDNTGNILWSRTFGDAWHDEVSSTAATFQQTSDSGFVLAYASDTVGQNLGISDIFLVKTDATGFSGCNEGNPTTIVTPLTLLQMNDSLHSDSLVLTETMQTITVSSAGTLVSICESIGIGEAKEETGIDIYPNPTTGKFTIKNAEFRESQTIEIYNTLSQKVMVVHLPTPNSLLQTGMDISMLRSGIYFVQATSGDKIFRGKVVKQ